ncbi:MAG: IS30 family transposase, partial [Candidatus Thiodiazotropha sp.]|nr:IS30 family transposase [Candidatus Thiodiazotropha sp.]MCM8885694.1 IS30 family transposase [Candidatus Thiodiazotropha sp.]MCM8922336.1 IS30 family transposase [Candidatus Thiodiazotropha sp.]
ISYTVNAYKAILCCTRLNIMSLRNPDIAKNIAAKLKAKFYFAHPYASWERGLNENTNGLIRQYFPKGSDFTTISQKEINQAMDKLNNRPRKCLGMKTPNQVFLGINPPVALAS